MDGLAAVGGQKNRARVTSAVLANRIVCKATEKGAFIKTNS